MDDFAHIVGEDVHFRGRSPSGERGLKFVASLAALIKAGRSPSGERGLKSTAVTISRTVMWSRSPSGERGLKYRTNIEADQGSIVAPHPGSVD